MIFEIGLCNLTTYVFKEHFEILKIYMVKFNVSILNRLKIKGLLYIQSKYINMSFLINGNENSHYFDKVFFHI